MTPLRTTLLVALLTVLAATAATAQWATDPSVNLLVGDGPGEQVVPHAAVVPDGGSFAGFTWVGWYDNDSANYDVAAQLLAPDGVPVFPQGGIIVSDQNQDSWVMDWSLAAGEGGFAIIAFADIRDGNSNIQVYRVEADGSFPWGPDGIQLTSNSDFKGPPCVAVTSDGHAVVAWMESSAGMKMQRLTADGTPLLAAGGLAVGEPDDAGPAGNLLVPSDDGDVILGYVPSYSFIGNRQIKAQRFDASGAAVWPSSVWVMDDATLPMGHYFHMTPDGQGGALFTWDVAVGMSFDARCQRITAAGAEALPHNGVYPEAAGAAGQIEPSAVWDAATDTYTMVYIDMTSTQNERGLNAQRFDAAGNRLWGVAGKVLLPLDGDMEVLPSLALVDGAPMGVVNQSPGGAWGQDQLLGFGLDDNGDFLWGGPVLVCSAPASRGDQMAFHNGVTMVAVWEDDRSGSPDIWAQNLNADGTLGAGTVAIDDDGQDDPVTLPPARFTLHPSYPNPFNPATTISFDLPAAAPVSLRIYDASGSMVRELVAATLPAAQHRYVWDGTDQAGRRQPSGVYFCRLVTDQRAVSRTMTLVK